MTEKKPASWSERFVVFLKSPRYKMLSSLFDGFIAGFFCGFIVMTLIVSQVFNASMPTNLVIWLLLSVMISVGSLLWGIHKALKES